MMMNSSSSGMAFRFRPTDEELISYLIKFISGTPIGCDHIRIVDLYGNKKPCDIFDDGESTDVNYLFTQLKKKSTHGKNVNRTVLGGGGAWKGLNSGKKVVSKKGSVIGLKRSFRFNDGNNSDHQRVVWNMKEYCLSDGILKALRKRNQIRHEEFVLCRIKREVVCSDDQKQVVNNYHDQGIGENNSSNNVVTDYQQATLELGYVGAEFADHQNHDIDYTYSSTVSAVSNSEEGFGANTNGFCATTDHYGMEENIGLSSSGYQKQISLCSSDNYHSHREINNVVNIGDNNTSNISVVSVDLLMPMPMVGHCLEDDPNYRHIDSSCFSTSSNLEEGWYCANNICDVTDFELLEVDEQELERAKVSFPLLEEKMSELSNILLRGNEDDYDQYHNLLRLPNTDDQVFQQLPNLNSSADYDQYYNLLTGNLLPTTDDQSSHQLPNLIASADHGLWS